MIKKIAILICLLSSVAHAAEFKKHSDTEMSVSESVQQERVYPLRSLIDRQHMLESELAKTNKLIEEAEKLGVKENKEEIVVNE